MQTKRCDLYFHETIIFLSERDGLCNPSLYFNFANVSNGVVPDVSGNDNNGRLQGEVQVNENYKCGRGIEFKNGQVTLNSKTFKGKPVSGVTLATWVWLDDLKDPTHQLFVTIDPGWKNPRFKSVYDFGITDKGAVHFSHRNVFGRRTTPSVNAKQWVHIAGTYNLQQDKVHIYVNGTEMTSFTRVDQQKSKLLSQDWSELAALGKFQYTRTVKRNMRGKMDEFYMYPCALGPKHIQKLKDRKCTESKYSFIYLVTLVRIIFVLI